MKNKTKILIAGIVAVMFLFPVLPVQGAVPQPYERQGVAYVDSAVAPKGANITAWIDGTRYGTDMVSDDAGAYYSFCDGNDTATATKTGGDAGNLVIYMYIWGPLMYIANETGTWTAGTKVSANLQITSANQPSSLKINELVVTPSSGNDYVFIYNPSAIALTNYQLEDNDGWSLSLGSGGTQVGDCTYFDLAGDILSSAGDELKLVWTNPTAYIAAGNNVPIDRVEYGNQSAGPDNTSLYDAPTPGTGQSIKRTPTNGTDTENCAADFTVGTATARPGTAVPPGAPRNALAAKSGTGDISITWEAAADADEYKVYKATTLNGNGPWTLVNTTTSLSVLRIGELSDNNNYSYIVNASNAAGTNTSNIVFKRCEPLIKPANPNINWVSLPYHCGYANIKELAIDVNHGDNNDYVIKVSFWDASTQSFKDSTWDEIDGWGGSSYSVTPGMAVQLFVKTAQTWKTVGSHNKSTSMDLIKPANPNINWVSLPYHCSYANIKELALDVNHADNDNYVIKVGFWDASTQSFKDSTWDEIDGWGGSGYAVTPGMAVQLFVKTAQTWAPDANDPYP